MSIVKISDASMKQLAKSSNIKLSFKNKLELAKLLDRIGVSVIELEGIEQVKADSLRIKSIATTVKESIIAVPVELNRESVETVWNALKFAKKPRLQVCVPVSTVQMEYIYHKKGPKMLDTIREMVSICREYAEDVEFIADDATRGDDDFIVDALKTAIEAGATTVTVCDAAGAMLPVEFSAFLENLSENIPELKNVTLGVGCSNALSMADACAVVAVRQGAREIKTVSYGNEMASLANVSKIIETKGGSFDAACRVRTVEMNRVMKQVSRLCGDEASKTSLFENSASEQISEFTLTSNDDITAVITASKKLGYDLSEEDANAVWEAFKQISSKKNEISSKELDAIIASAAMQVPPTYKLESYVINNGNIIKSTAHITLTKDGETLDNVALGDGPIAAAFQAIENIEGRHFELDDFQIRSVTEGREAMGEAVVRLMSNGKLYSGRGISTDIVASSIKAYINALNKIVYEEAEA